MRNLIIYISFLIGQFALGQVSRYQKVWSEDLDRFNFSVEHPGIQGRFPSNDLKIVFSDRKNNITYADPLGLELSEKQEFLTAFYIVGQEDDFYELIKVDPENIGKPKGLFSFFYKERNHLKDFKKTEYVGWMHKDNLLHYQAAKISPHNYQPIEYITGVHDVHTLLDLRYWTKKDSIQLYADPQLNNPFKKLPLHQFVHLFKVSRGEKALLIGTRAEIPTKEEEKEKAVFGWIPTELLREIGQREVADIQVDSLMQKYHHHEDSMVWIQNALLKNDFIFRKKLKEVTDNDHYDYEIIDSSGYNLHHEEILARYKVWDHSKNKLINIRGESFPIAFIDQIEKEQKNINFHLLFDCSQVTKKELNRLVASIQKIWVELSKSTYRNYHFSFSSSSFGCTKAYQLKRTQSFSEWIDYLQEIFSGDILPNAQLASDEITPALRFSEKNMSNQFETNIVLVAGRKSLFKTTEESNGGVPPACKSVLKKMAKKSARMLFYQVESSPSMGHQDFILQAKEILDLSANYYKDFLSDYLVDHDMLIQDNNFTDLSNDNDNIYLYDSPNQSLYDGGLIFPKIGKRLQAPSFEQALDSIFNKSFGFNQKFIASLENTADKFGFLRSHPRPVVYQLLEESEYGKNKVHRIAKRNKKETLYQSTNIFNIDSLQKGFLMKKEEIVTYLELSRSVIPIVDKPLTKKDRRRLKKVYKRNVKNLNDKFGEKILNNRNYISDMIFYKTGFCVQDEELNYLRIKDVRKKRILNHQEFTKAMKNARQRIDDFEFAWQRNRFPIFMDGGGNTFYYVPINYFL
ncbi:MAG: hypothetical protein N4A45_00575 [Flavobacteriales bacterium]|jgi:hypothetical protein|nr:hypothetical protein [Flavobacteriales bacterium]